MFTFLCMLISSCSTIFPASQSKHAMLAPHLRLQQRTLSAQHGMSTLALSDRSKSETARETGLENNSEFNIVLDVIRYMQEKKETQTKEHLIKKGWFSLNRLNAFMASHEKRSKESNRSKERDRIKTEMQRTIDLMKEIDGFTPHAELNCLAPSSISIGTPRCQAQRKEVWGTTQRLLTSASSSSASSSSSSTSSSASSSSASSAHAAITLPLSPRRQRRRPHSASSLRSHARSRTPSPLSIESTSAVTPPDPDRRRRTPAGPSPRMILTPPRHEDESEVTSEDNVDTAELISMLQELARHKQFEKTPLAACTHAMKQMQSGQHAMQLLHNLGIFSEAEQNVLTQASRYSPENVKPITFDVNPDELGAMIQHLGRQLEQLFGQITKKKTPRISPRLLPKLSPRKKSKETHKMSAPHIKKIYEQKQQLLNSLLHLMPISCAVLSTYPESAYQTEHYIEMLYQWINTLSKQAHIHTFVISVEIDQALQQAQDILGTKKTKAHIDKKDLARLFGQIYEACTQVTRGHKIIKIIKESKETSADDEKASSSSAAASSSSSAAASPPRASSSSAASPPRDKKKELVPLKTLCKKELCDEKDIALAHIVDAAHYLLQACQTENKIKIFMKLKHLEAFIRETQDETFEWSTEMKDLMREVQKELTADTKSRREPVKTRKDP